ncbi:MAG: hypothetical protein WCZ28_13960 [Burkholderiaceae bacterium]
MPGRPDQFVRTAVAGTILGLAMPIMALAQAQGGGAADSPQGYEADRALCISGLSHQEREDCLREAAAARQAARRGQLDDGDAEYRRNALRRCDALPPQAREDCLARMRGEGTMIEGSVEEGGIYRERRELIPAPAPARPPAAGGAGG